MYQESILRAHQAEESVGSITHEETAVLLAPANDPFVTANVLSEYIEGVSRSSTITNLYLCPLGTNPQLIGMVLYYLYEQEGKPASLIYPYCKTHHSKTSVGISRAWKYTIEF